MKGNTLFFIVGPHRSGTTLLRRILDKHPEAAVTPELHFFDQALAGLGLRRDTGAETRAIVQSPRIARYIREQGADAAAIERELRAAPDTQSRFLAIARLTASKKEYSLLAEKTPVNIFFVRRIARLFPEASFIFIIRDGREVIASALKKWDLRGAKHLMIAARWALAAQAYYADVVGREHCFLKYEDVVREPDRELNRLFDFLGLEYRPEYKENVGASSSFEEFSDRSILYESKHFKDVFPESVRREAEYFLRPYLLKLGYECEFDAYDISFAARVRYWYYYNHHRLYFWLCGRGLKGLYRRLRNPI